LICGLGPAGMFGGKAPLRLQGEFDYGDGRLVSALAQRDQGRLS